MCVFQLAYSSHNVSVLPNHEAVGGRRASDWLILAFQSMPSIAASPIRIAASWRASIRSSNPHVFNKLFVYYALCISCIKAGYFFSWNSTCPSWPVVSWFRVAHVFLRDFSGACFFYSFRKASTGFDRAAFIVWKLTVIMAIRKAKIPLNIKNSNPRSTRYA